VRRDYGETDVDRITPNNWLDDHFWLNIAYHSWRVPLPVNSNWWLLMKEDASIPEDFRASVPEKGELADLDSLGSCSSLRLLRESSQASSPTGRFDVLQSLRNDSSTSSYASIGQSR
jgi:hypothetical protein